MGLGRGFRHGARGRVHPRGLPGDVQLPDPVREPDCHLQSCRNHTKRFGTGRFYSGQDQRSGKSRNHSLPDRPVALSSEGEAARCVPCPGPATGQATRFGLRTGHRQCRGLDGAACVQSKANVRYREANRRTGPDSIQDAGYPGSIRNGELPAAGSQGGPSHRQTRDGFGNRRCKHGRCPNRGAARKREVGAGTDNRSCSK